MQKTGGQSTDNLLLFILRWQLKILYHVLSCELVVRDEIFQVAHALNYR